MVVLKQNRHLIKDAYCTDQRIGLGDCMKILYLVNPVKCSEYDQLCRNIRIILLKIIQLETQGRDTGKLIDRLEYAVHRCLKFTEEEFYFRKNNQINIYAWPGKNDQSFEEPEL